MNAVNVQMLSPKLYAQVFGRPDNSRHSPTTSTTSMNVMNGSLRQHEIDLMKEILKMHKLDISKSTVMKEVDLDLPELKGGDIREHFKVLGDYIAHPYQR